MLCTFLVFTSKWKVIKNKKHNKWQRQGKRKEIDKCYFQDCSLLIFMLLQSPKGRCCIFWPAFFVLKSWKNAKQSFKFGVKLSKKWEKALKWTKKVKKCSTRKLVEIHNTPSCEAPRQPTIYTTGCCRTDQKGPYLHTGN